MRPFFRRFKKKPSKGRLESEVVSGVLSYLELRGDVFFWRQNVFAGVVPGGYIHAEKGVSDILCVKMGRLHAFEAKREVGGVESEDQKRFGANVVAAGGVYAVVNSVDEVQKILGAIGPRIQISRRPPRIIHR